MVKQYAGVMPACDGAVCGKASRWGFLEVPTYVGPYALYAKEINCLTRALVVDRVTNAQCLVVYLLLLPSHF